MDQSQKNYIKKHIQSESLSLICQKLNITEKEVTTYLGKKWGSEKLKKFISNTQVQPNTQNYNLSFSRFFKKNWIILTALTFIVFIAYINSLGNQFLSDDLPTIVNDKQLSSITYVTDYPLSATRRLFYFLAYQIGGLSPIYFRLINIFFHLGTVYMVYALVYRLYSRRLAIFSSLLFAVHPLLTESVTWISGGAYTQAAFFLMVSLTSYVLLSKQLGNKSGVTDKFLYPLSLISFLLALTSQATPVILPGVLLIYELCYGSIRNNWKLLVPFYLLSLTSPLIGLGGVSVFGISERQATLERVHYQEQGFNNPLLELPVTITSYLQLIFFPSGLTLYHSELSVSLFEFITRSIILVVFLSIWLLSYFKKKFIFFWISFFLLSLLPTMIPSFFKLTWILAERYVYLGTIAITIVIAKCFEVWSNRPNSLRFSYAIFSLVIIYLLIKTIIRNSDWQDQDHLWISASYTSPSSPNNHNNLGDMYGRHGDKQTAIKEFQIAIALKPNYADAYHNLANTYQEIGDSNQALENYQKAIQINPNLWQSYQNIAGIYFSLGKSDQALQTLSKGLQNNPSNLNLENDIGIIYLKQNDLVKAGQIFSSVLSQDPTNQQAQQGLALTSK